MQKLAVFSLLFAAFINDPAIAQWQGMSVDQVIPTEKRIYSLALSNTNNDRNPDIIALPTEPFTSVLIYRGDDSNQFDFSHSFEKNDSYRVIKTGDLDGDEVDDIVLSSYWSNGFKIYWSTAGGGYAEGDYYGLTGHGKNIETVDIDGDNDLDIVAFSGGSGQPITMHLFKNNRSRSLISSGVYRSDLHTDKRITIVDKNQDGRLDIMVASSFPWFVIFYQENDGSFTPRYWPHKFEFPFTSEYYLADLNNDSKEDIIANYFEEGFRFYAGQADTLFSEQYSLYSTSLKLLKLLTTDLNRDGFVDLVSPHYSEEYVPTDSVFYLLGKGDFTFEEPQLIRFPSAVNEIVVKDFNNDEFPDFVASTANGIVTVVNEGLVTGIEEPIDPHSVFPNPFQNELTISGSQGQFTTVFDALGKPVASIAGNGTIDTSQLPVGMYFVKVQKGRGAKSFKTVKN